MARLDGDEGAGGVVCVDDGPVGAYGEELAYLYIITIYISDKGEKWDEKRNKPLSLSPAKVPPVIGATIRVPLGPWPRKIIPLPVMLALYRYVSPKPSPAGGETGLGVVAAVVVAVKTAAAASFMSLVKDIFMCFVFVRARACV